MELVPAVEGANRRVRSSSIVLAINSPKWAASETGGVISTHTLTWLPFSNDNTTSIKDIFELFKIEITICSTGGGACGYNRFLDSQLDGKGLVNKISELLYPCKV